MSQKIFISYRRDDASADARSIYQRLRTTFGKDQLFIDVDTIEKGRDFREALDKNLDACRVLVAVIGPKWLGVENEAGTRRLDDRKDFVRLEITRALAKNIVVIPVVVGNAVIPKAEELPEDVRALVFRQAAVVRHESFPQDMEALEQEIRKHVRVRRRLPWVAAGGALFVACLLTSPWWWLGLERSLNAFSLFTANAARDKDIASVMARCIKSPPHPDKDDIVVNIAERLSNQSHEYGWTSEAASADKSNVITWMPMTEVSASNGELKIKYDWRNGRLRLVPVVQRPYATRGLASPARSRRGVAAILQGAWSQNNGYGCIELVFDDAGDAHARWGVATSDDYDAEAFVRKTPSPNDSVPPSKAQ